MQYRCFIRVGTHALAARIYKFRSRTKRQPFASSHTLAYVEKDLFPLNGTARSIVGFCVRDHTAADLTAAELTAADHSPSAERQRRRQRTILRPFHCESAARQPSPDDGLSAQPVQETGMRLPTPLQETAQPAERSQMQPAYAEKDLFPLKGKARSIVGFCARDLTAADLAAADLTATDHSPSAERQRRRQGTIPRPFHCESAVRQPCLVDDQSSLSAKPVQETGMGLPSQMAL